MKVTSTGPAVTAGVESSDVILDPGGHATPSPQALTAELATMTPGQKVKVRLLRHGGGSQAVTITLGQYSG